MILYGTRVESGFDLPFAFPESGAFRGEVLLSPGVPEALRHTLRSRTPLFVSHGRKVSLLSDRPAYGAVAAQAWGFEVEGVVEFCWRQGEGRIHGRLLGEGTPELLAFWFAHQMLPLWLTLERRYDFLHAGAVEVEGRVIAFLAPSMGGKSTLTDYFIRQGHRLVTDDKLPFFREEGRFLAMGSHAHHRPFREFEVMGYRVENYLDRPAPLDALYFLERGGGEGVTLEEIRGFGKFERVMSSFLYTFPFLQAEQLAHLGGLLEQTRLFRLVRPWDLTKLPEVYGAVLTNQERTP